MAQFCYARSGVGSSTTFSFVSPEFPGESSGAISLNFTTQPSISSTATTIDQGGEAIIAEASLSYSFQVVYTGSGTPVSAAPINIIGTLSAAGTEPGEAYISVSGVTPGEYDGYEFGSAILAGSVGSDSFDISGLGYLSDVYSVYVSASSEAGVASNFESSSASVDPVITIGGAGLPDPSDYEIVFSPNLTPASVPDSYSTLTLLGGALVGLAALRRRFVK